MYMIDLGHNVLKSREYDFAKKNEVLPIHKMTSGWQYYFVQQMEYLRSGHAIKSPVRYVSGDVLDSGLISVDLVVLDREMADAAQVGGLLFDRQDIWRPELPTPVADGMPPAVEGFFTSYRKRQ